jgi:diguanylate cyclase (GGDEF)-like protein
VSDVTVVLIVAAAVLGGLSIALFLVAIRRLLRRESEIVAVMLRRYDDRLAMFAQTLNDALAATVVPSDEIDLELEDPGLLMRTLELAVERTGADGAIALVAGLGVGPTVATVGLSEAEAQHLARLGATDTRGARAIEIALGGDLAAPPGQDPVRGGLIVPLFGPAESRSLLAVLSRVPERRFSEDDVLALDTLVRATRPALERTLGMREPDVVPDLDPLTGLYDRRAFGELVDREIERARRGAAPLSLLIADVDRLTTMNARLGRLKVDDLLAVIGARIQTVKGRLDYACRLEGGRFSILCPGARAEDCEALFERLQAELSREPVDPTGVVSITGGVTELLPDDDARGFTARADAALRQAKATRRGSVVAT